MKEIKQKIDKAYGYLSKIPVNGDFVEPMALARQELREAYTLAEAREKEQEKEQDKEKDKEKEEA